MPFRLVRVVIVVLSLAGSSGGAFAEPAGTAAPKSLRAISATRSEVKLSWDASDTSAGYIVESLGQNKQWATVPPTRTETSATIQVEPFAAYTFRVRATGADGSTSEPSNEVTVGPPPTGFQLVTPTLKGLVDRAQFAPKMVMTLDDNGDPCFAYLIIDPNNDRDLADTELSFVSWNRASYRWNAPVKVDTVGEINLNGTLVGLSPAVDSSNHRFGVAYMVGQKEVRLALSNDAGATWKSQTVQQDSESTFGEPSLALAKGRLYLAYFHTNDGVRYRTGAEDDPPDKWSSQLAPKLPATGEPHSAGISVALDAAGKPALAYLLGPEDGSNLTIAFWRPDARSAVKITDSNGNGHDDPDAHLVFQGTQPRVIFYMRRDEKFWNASNQIWVARSKDDGANWDTPIPLPNDGGNSMGFPFSLSIASNGRVAATAHVDGGNNVNTRCGQPKLMQSADFTHWTICAPGTPDGSPAKDISNPQLTFAGNDKLYIGYVSSTGAKIGAGILLWREP